MSAAFGGPVIIAGVHGSNFRLISALVAEGLGTGTLELATYLEGIIDDAPAVRMSRPDDYGRECAAHYGAWQSACEGRIGVLTGAELAGVLKQLEADSARVFFIDTSLALAAKALGLDAPRPLGLPSPRALWNKLANAQRQAARDAGAHVLVDSEMQPPEIARRILEAVR